MESIRDILRYLAPKIGDYLCVSCENGIENVSAKRETQWDHFALARATPSSILIPSNGPGWWSTTAPFTKGKTQTTGRARRVRASENSARRQIDRGGG